VIETWVTKDLQAKQLIYYNIEPTYQSSIKALLLPRKFGKGYWLSLLMLQHLMSNHLSVNSTATG
jgi:hypothetical protein